MELGMLILRLVIGLLFVGHGTQKLFGWFGGHGVEGTSSFFESLGYRPGKPHAVLAGVTEAGGGALLTLGFLTPLGGAMILGVMVNAIVSVHAPNGLWVTDNGIEYPLVAATAALMPAFVTPGYLAVDSFLGWNLHGTWWGLTALVVGLAAATAMLATTGGEAVKLDMADMGDEEQAEAA